MRKLGAGSRAEVFLGHAERGLGGKPELVALKVFREGASEVSVSAEISALSTLHHPHMVQLIDLASTAQGQPVLILNRLSPSGLGRLLADRAHLDPGEAVTILVPLSEALGAMHSHGFSHGGVGATNVLFDESGAPVFIGFGGAGNIGNRDRDRDDGRGSRGVVIPAARESDGGVQADLRGLSLLATAVLSRVPPSSLVEGVNDWLLESARRSIDADFAEQLRIRLFEMAFPEPVRNSDEAGPTGSSAEDAVGAVRDAFSSRLSASPAGSSVTNRARQEPRTAIGLVTEFLKNRLQLIAGFLASTKRALLQVRRRVWVLAVVAVLAVACAGVLVLFTSSDSGSAESETPAEENALTRGEANSRNLATEEPHEDVAAVTGNDPVLALEVLLELRERCFDDRSVLCLDNVNQPDSAAWAADVSRVRGVQEGEELPSKLGTGRSELLERLGDLALLTVPLAASAPDAPDAAGESATASEVGS